MAGVSPRTHSANALDVPLAVRGRYGARARRYDGPVHDGLVVRKDAKGRWTWFGDNWPNRARQWMPSGRSSERQGDRDVDGARADGADRGRRTASSLGATSTRGASGRTETRWRETRPIPPYLMVIAAARSCASTSARRRAAYARSHAVRAAVRVRDAREQRRLPGAFARAGAIVALFEARRPVPVREARAPAVVHALRRDGERERDLLRRKAVSDAAR